MPLSSRLAILVSVVVAVCFLGFGAYQAREQSEFAEKQIQSITRAVAENISASVADDILNERWDNVEALLLRLSIIGNVAELTVADSGGRIISRVKRTDRTPPHAEYAADTRIAVPGHPVETTTGTAYSYVMPIKRGEPLGVVAVTSSIESLDVIRRQIFVDTLLATWTAMSISILVLGIALRGIVRSLEKTAHFAASLSDDRGTQLQIESNVLEVRTLVEAINRMSSDLASQDKALRQSVRELEYQKFALDQHSIVSIADASGTITYVNQKFTEISGYSIEELVGANHRLIKSGLHAPEFYREMWETISKGSVWNGQIANRGKDGQIYWVASTIVPWLDENGLPYQYVSIRTDITAQKAIEHALAEARQRELDTGYEIQKSLLLGEVPYGLHGAWIATHSEPSQGIDGDFFALNRYSSTCFDLLVGDVMGKGVPAALIGAAVRNTYNQVLAELLATSLGVSRLPEPAAVINALHHSLTPRLIALDSFVTLALYRFDLEKGALTFVNAGHTPGLLSRAHGARVESVHGQNLPIGVMAEEVYAQSSLQVGPGDALLAYSDGITEAQNGEGQWFGEERLRRLVQASQTAGLPPSVAMQALRQKLREFTGNQQPKDDQTSVMIELIPRREPPRGTISQRRAPEIFELKWELGALSELRERIGAAANELSEDARNALVLAAFEAATNIVRHVRPSFANTRLCCRIIRDDASLSVELIYPGAPFNPPAEPVPDFSGDSEGGFGLFIIQQSADVVEYGHHMDGICSIRLVKRGPQLAQDADA